MKIDKNEYNPGMSEKAWANLHKFVARKIIKYQHKMFRREKRDDHQ